MSNKTNKLLVPDFIAIGVFTALYFVLVTIAIFFSMDFLGGFSYILLPAISALISGSVYMLMFGQKNSFLTYRTMKEKEKVLVPLI